MTRPLSHIRVLDFGHYLAGPLVGMMLADMGAEVIRIVSPKDNLIDEPSQEMLSRGKKYLTLNLKLKADHDTAMELIKRSDVLIENFRPGVMDNLGLGQMEVRGINNQIIYLSLPGFASTDAELANLPAWEAIIAAYTGQFTDMGLNRRLMGINPSFTPLTLASAYGSSFGAMSVLFALYARDHNGGDYIEVPLASALLEGLVYNCEQIEDYPQRYKSPREVELERRIRQGEPLNFEFSELSEFLDPFYRTYTCSDGRGFYVVSGSVATHPRRVLETLGLSDLADKLPDFSAYLESSKWPSGWSMKNYPVGDEDRARISSAMKASFLTRPSHEWEALFGAAKAPATAQRFTKEWLHDEHALASGLILEVNNERYGKMQQMGNIAWLADDVKACVKDSLQAADIVSLLQSPIRHGVESKAGAWLDNIKVLDLTNVIAGPTIGSTLARYGAEVTLVQPVEPSVDPWNTVVFGIHAQRGKESILIDLSTDKGQQILDQLIVASDVITINGTDEQRDKLNLSEDRLKKNNPQIILVQLDAFGGPKRGPKSDHLGYDDLAQAATGVMVRFGGGMETPEEHAHFGTIDVLTGFCACVALGGALLKQKATGQSSVARSSLAAAGNLIQAQFMYDYANRAPFDEPAGRKVLGSNIFYHCYEASDGWFFFAAPTERNFALTRVDSLSDLVDLPQAELFAALIVQFKTQSISYWRSALTHGSSAVVPLASLHSTRDASIQIESEGEIDISKSTFRVIRHDNHPMGRWCDLVAPNAVRSQFGKITIPKPMPKYGADSHKILARLGFSTKEIQKLIDDNVVGEMWSEKYLPE